METRTGKHIAMSGAGFVVDDEVTIDMVGIFYKIRMEINLDGLAGTITFFSPTGENLGTRDINVSTLIYP